ncbi:hypothetical protein CUMW_271350 [Citrus unshiu]|uniref:Uncharacterized protein n=1 Tax=Citrus unshiu TaxID=55188 RepID=A0A2H5QXL6_CITUN|nr:hypothetical protein CUMW_271350 [Citrus unshiu]
MEEDILLKDSKISPKLFKKLSTDCLVMQNHHDINILETFDGANQASTLQFVKNISPELLKKLSTDCLVMQNHHI